MFVKLMNSVKLQQYFILHTDSEKSCVRR